MSCHVNSYQTKTDVRHTKCFQRNFSQLLKLPSSHRRNVQNNKLRIYAGMMVACFVVIFQHLRGGKWGKLNKHLDMC
jgi:hypothetical protein